MSMMIINAFMLLTFGMHRIVEWKFGAKMGEVVAGGNGRGNRMDQLDMPIDIVVDEKTDSLIICDYENRRVVRWPRRNGREGQTLISDIECMGVAMDNNGDLYVSDGEKNEVRRWKVGEKKGTVVAGGNGKGDQLNQFNFPTSLFVDEDHSVYVSDHNNNRVMKWVKGGKEGVVVAGGQDEENCLTQLSSPYGVIVDHLGQVYVADCVNHRIVRWSKGSKEGHVVLGGNGRGQQPNQFNHPTGLSFDRKGNLYVADSWNHRIERFAIDM